MRVALGARDGLGKREADPAQFSRPPAATQMQHRAPHEARADR
jgi:hypothetical protein